MNAAAPRRSTPRRTARGAGPAPAPTPSPPDTPPPLVATAGFRIAPPSEVPAGAALVGRAVLYQWPTEGWVRRTVTRRSRAAGFSHVVRYALGSAVTPSESRLDGVDAASHAGPDRSLGAPSRAGVDSLQRNDCKLSVMVLGWLISHSERLGRPGGPRAVGGRGMRWVLVLIRDRGLS